MSEFEEWARDAVKRNAPKVKESGIFLSIFTEGYEKDPLAVLQFGLAILLDKPIGIVAPFGTKIPENVKRIAKSIEFFDNSMDGATDATKRVLNNMGVGE